MYMKVTGWMTKPTDTDNIFIWMELFIQVIGKMINNMVSESKHGLTAPNMKDYTRKERNMDKGNFFGLTDLNFLVNSKIIISMVKALMNGATGENILEHGRIIRWTARVSSPGVMAENISDPIWMI